MALETRHEQSACATCGERVVVAVPPVGSENDPHWAEAYPQQDDRYMVCWNCGKVLWAD